MADQNIDAGSEIIPANFGATDKGYLGGRGSGKYWFSFQKIIDRANHTGNVPAANVSGLDAAISSNSNVANNTTNNHTHGNKSTLDAITAQGSGIIISAAERTKLSNLVVTDNQNIITNAQIANLNDFVLSKTSQSLSGTSQAFDLSNGYLLESTISGTTTLTFSNVQTGRNGVIYLVNTDGNTLNLAGSGITFQKSNQGVLEAYGAITLEAGATTVQILTYHCRSNTQITYEIK